MKSTEPSWRRCSRKSVRRRRERRKRRGARRDARYVIGSVETGTPPFAERLANVEAFFGTKREEGESVFDFVNKVCTQCVNNGLLPAE